MVIMGLLNGFFSKVSKYGSKIGGAFGQSTLWTVSLLLDILQTSNILGGEIARAVKEHKPLELIDTNKLNKELEDVVKKLNHNSITYDEVMQNKGLFLNEIQSYIPGLTPGGNARTKIKDKVKETEQKIKDTTNKFTQAQRELYAKQGKISTELDQANVENTKRQNEFYDTQDDTLIDIIGKNKKGK